MEENTNANFEFYPNPATNQITLKVDNQLLGSIYTICDNTGKSVLNGYILSENSVINLENLSKGFYLLSIAENLERTVKVIKE
jgi:hypothetical protein